MSSDIGMRLTRRDVHKGLLGILLTSGMSVSARPAPMEVVALNRLTFGATPESRDAMQKMGLSGWLDQELAKPLGDASMDARLSAATLEIKYKAGENDGESWDALKEMRPYNALTAAPEELLQQVVKNKAIPGQERRRPADEVRAASLIRAVHAEAQLREMMTAFWHDHFNVNAYRNQRTSAYFPSYDRMLRENALGNFRTLLGNVARAPAMLTYLDNYDSRASPANENFARELLELHTLGAMHYHSELYDNWREVPGALNGLAEGYIDQDVYEVARAFTGWSIGTGGRITQGINSPTTGQFYYIESWHDPYQKRILGIEFAPNRAPMADGEDVMDILAHHPGTAHHIAGKLLTRLGIEKPSAEYHAATAASFSQNVDAPDQIAQVIRTIVLHDEFAATPPTKIRRPFEFLAAIYRASGAEVTAPTADVLWHLEQAGWTQHTVVPPTGHSDHTEDWANSRTLNGLINLALYAHRDWLGGQRYRSGTLQSTASLPDLIEEVEDRFAAPVGTVRAACEQMGIATDQPLPDDPDARSWVVGVMHAAAALQPQFVLR